MNPSRMLLKLRRVENKQRRRMVVVKLKLKLCLLEKRKHR
jgi:hypothetical protein